MEHQSHEIFVPGRLCVLGEHSDWAGQYRYQNPAVSVGKAYSLTLLLIRFSVIITSKY